MKFIGVIAALSFLVAGSVSAHAAGLGLDCPENNTNTPSPPQMLKKNVTPYTYTPIPKPPPASNIKPPALGAKIVHDLAANFIAVGDHSGSVAFPKVKCDTVLVVPFTTTSGLNSYGRFVALTENQVNYQISVSTTPGNFSVPSLCYGSGGAGASTIYYSPTGVFTASSQMPACTVEPGKQYYYNIRLTKSCAADGTTGNVQTTRYIDLP